jgi:hypothetical protein
MPVKDLAASCAEPSFFIIGLQVIVLTAMIVGLITFFARIMPSEKAFHTSGK